MAEPENIRVAAAIGSVNGTNAFVAVHTPVQVWGWNVHNGEASLQNAGVGATTNAVFTVPYASGSSHVPAYGYKLDSLALQVTHTNSTMFCFYTPYQD